MCRPALKPKLQRSPSYGPIFYIHSFKLAHVSPVLGPGKTSKYPFTVLPSVSSSFPHGPIGLCSILFGPLIGCQVLRSGHHSFISISPRVIWVARISYLPCLRQSLRKPLRRRSYLKIHPFPPFRPYPSLQLLVSPSPSSVFFFPFSLCWGLSSLSSIPIMAEPFFILPIILPPDLFLPRGRPPSFPVNNTSSLTLASLKRTTVGAARQ